MKRFLKTYWAEVLVVGAIFGVLLLCTAPNYTWINTDSDGIHYVYSAQYLFPSHKTSAPLFLLLGRLFLYIPYGTEAWRMGLMSVLASTGTAVFVYLAIRHHLSELKQIRARIYALIGVVVFGGSALVISQSTIVETYALVTMFCVGAYYFSLKGRWWLCAIMLGAGLAVHTLAIVVVLLIMLFRKDFRCWEYAGVMAGFMLFYLYIPITTAINNPPNMWGNITLKSFLNDNYSTTMMLLGGLSVWDLPKRIFDTIGILGVSLGLAVVPIAIMFRKLKSLLLWLFIMPIIFFATNLAVQTFVYLLPTIAFGAILAAIGLSRMRVAWAYAVGIVAVGLLLFNANYLDIGRTCFPVGTKIVSRKKQRGWHPASITDAESIENIKVGDEVLSFNTQSGKKEYKPVTRVFHHKANDFIVLRFSNGNEIRCTPEHPIAIDNRGKITWVQAKDLQIDDKCVQFKYHRLGNRLRNISDRGKSIEERYGQKKAEELRKQWSEKHQILRADPNSVYYSESYAENMSQIVRAGYKLGVRKSWSTGLTKETDERVKKLGISISKNYKKHPEVKAILSEKQKANWKNPDSTFHTDEYWNAYRKGRSTKPSSLERRVQSILDSAFPGTWIYTGDYSFPIKNENNGRRRFPDFKHYCYRKLLEVFNKFDKVRKYGSIKRYKQITTGFYRKVGYEVCYLSWDEVHKFPEGIVEKVRKYTYNPNIFIVEIVDKQFVQVHKEDVYNLEVEGNNNYYACGILVHNCDPNLSATKFYNEELAKVPDGQILMPQYGWEWASIYPYNKRENRNIIPICVDTLVSPIYQEQLKEQGIKFGDIFDRDVNRRQAFIATSIVNMNDNVWTTVTTDTETYGAKVVLAEDNLESVNKMPTEPPAQWHFKPSNPYGIIIGSVEITEWGFVTWSNWNCLFFIQWGTFGFFAYWLAMRFYKRRTNEVRTDEGIEKA